MDEDDSDHDTIPPEEAPTLKVEESTGQIGLPPFTGDTSSGNLLAMGFLSEAHEIPGYDLGKILGEGGFGSVYRAHQTGEIERDVALKLIKPGMASGEITRRFEAERQALARMDHPNIAKVFDAGTTPDGRPYFAMELAEGPSITAYCDQRRLRLADRVRLFRQVVAGVEHAHQRAILHRDLKPSNILIVEVDGKPVPKIIDFGIAKALGNPLTDETMLTLPGTVMGTPNYMSPEQFGSVDGTLDTRSDVYALGVILYELIAGRLPIDAAAALQKGVSELDRVLRGGCRQPLSSRISKEDETSKKFATNRSGSLDQLRREVRGDLEAIVTKSLEVKPAERYQSAAALGEDLRRFQSFEPVTAAQPNAFYRARKFARRHRGPLLVASSLLAVVVIGAAASVWQAIRATQFAEQAEAARLRAESQLSAARARTMLGSSPNDALQLATETAREELRRDGEVSSPVAFALADSLLHARQIDSIGCGSAVRAITQFPAENGRKLAIINGGHLRIVDLSRGENRWINAGIRAHSIAALPNQNTHLAVGATNGSIAIFDLSKTKPIELHRWTAHDSSVIGLRATKEGHLLSVSSKGEVGTWLGTDGSPVHPAIQTDSGNVDTVAWERGTNRVAIGSAIATDRCRVSLADHQSGDISATLTPPSGWLGAVGFRPGTGELVTGGSDAVVRFWTAEGQSHGRTNRGHRSEIFSVAWHPSGRIWASADSEGKIQLFDDPDDRNGIELVGHAGPIPAMLFLDDGLTLCTGGQDQTLRIWDLSGLQAAAPVPIGHPTRGVVFSDDGDRFATASEDGQVRIFQYPTGEILSETKCHDTSSRALASQPGRSSSAGVLAVGSDGTSEVVLVDWNGNIQGRIDSGLVGIDALSFNATGDLLLAAPMRGHPISIDPTTLSVFPEPPAPETGWNKLGAKNNTFQFLTENIFAVRCSRSLWNVETGTRTVNLDVAFKHQERALVPLGESGIMFCGRAQASGHRRIRVLDITTGQRLVEAQIPLGGHVVCGGSSPDRRFLVLGDDSGQIVGLDQHLTPVVPVFQAHHEGPVRTISFHPTGNSFATAGDDGMVRFWMATPDRWLNRMTLRNDGKVNQLAGDWGRPPTFGDVDTTSDRGDDGESTSPKLGNLAVELPPNWSRMPPETVAFFRSAVQGRLGENRKRLTVLGGLSYTTGKAPNLFSDPIIIACRIPEMSSGEALANRLPHLIDGVQKQMSSSFSNLLRDVEIANVEWNGEEQYSRVRVTAKLMFGQSLVAEAVWIPQEGPVDLYFISGGTLDTESRIIEARRILTTAPGRPELSPERITELGNLLNASSEACERHLVGVRFDRLSKRLLELKSKGRLADAKKTVEQLFQIVNTADPGVNSEKWATRRLTLLRRTISVVGTKEGIDDTVLSQIQSSLEYWYSQKPDLIEGGLPWPPTADIGWALNNLTGLYVSRVTFDASQSDEQIVWMRRKIEWADWVESKGQLNTAKRNSRFAAQANLAKLLINKGLSEEATAILDTAARDIVPGKSIPDQTGSYYQLRSELAFKAGDIAAGHEALQSRLEFAIGFVDRAPNPEWGEGVLVSSIEGYRRSVATHPDFEIDQDLLRRAEAKLPQKAE